MSLNFDKDFDKKMSNCPLCGSKEIENHKTDYKGVKIDKCQSCNIEFMNPQYTDEYLNKYYSSYVEIENSNENNTWSEALMEGHNFYISQIEKYAPKENKRFLSIGSGEGWELRQALKKGWEAEGYDVDETTTSKLSEKLSVPVKSGDFVKLDYPKDFYSAVYMHHVLEHPKNPQEYLRKIHTILEDKGILFIACPNIDSLANRFKSVLDLLGIKKRHAKHYDTFHHVFYYNPYKLKKLLEKHYGFKVQLIRNGYHVRPNQSQLKRWLLKNILEVIPYKSTFMLVAQKA
jgi:SAM-dependent methyltransferase